MFRQILVDGFSEIAIAGFPRAVACGESDDACKQEKREVTYEMFENTIRLLLAGSPMLFCEWVITGSNKNRLRLGLGTENGPDASNGNGMLRGWPSSPTERTET